mgnify:CR=1 FL=1
MELDYTVEKPFIRVIPMTAEAIGRLHELNVISWDTVLDNLKVVINKGVDPKHHV